MNLFIFLTSFILGSVIATIQVRINKTKKEPIWSIKVYLQLFTVRQPRKLQEYAKSRTHFSIREQFMGAAFLWSFILFIILISLFGETVRW